MICLLGACCMPGPYWARVLLTIFIITLQSWGCPSLGDTSEAYRRYRDLPWGPQLDYCVSSRLGSVLVMCDGQARKEAGVL